VQGPKGFNLGGRIEEVESRVKTDTDRGKGCDFFDPLLVVRDLISRRTLLAEPENPTRD
jgi:hypothetical protein